jgi:Fur family transcriptional regulator, ferric uptake regulator
MTRTTTSTDTPSGASKGFGRTDVRRYARAMPSADLHEVVAARLRRVGQRYTKNRQGLVDVLAACEQPVTIHQVLERDPSIPQSSAYRNIAVLEQAGAVHRIVTADDFARFELAQDLTEHHHHLICSSCGEVTDFTLPSAFEGELGTRLDRAARRRGFSPTDHRLDVLGTCERCRQG